jgi:ligand-binding sensor domain-containing protein/signal transduction histidine kinase
MNARSALVIRLAVSTCLLAAASSGQSATPTGNISYDRQTWRTENGLPQNSVHSIVQTSDGYMWLATEGGLARFDGLKFTVFDTENTAALRSNNIKFLLETADKSLWIATADGLVRKSGGSFQSFTTDQGLPANNILSLLKDNKGVLWVITAEGVGTYQDGRFARRSVSAFPENRILASAVDGQGNIWLGTAHGLLVQAADVRHLPSIPRALQNASVQALLADRHGRLWAGSGDKLIVVGERRSRAFNFEEHIAPSNITALAEDRAGTVWVGTETSVLRIASDQIVPLDLPESGSHTPIASFLEDREGNFWVGTDSAGVTILRPQKFRTFGRAAGVPDDLIRCVLVDQKGVVWAGTNGSGLKHLDGATFSSLTTGNGLSSDVVLSLAAGAGGELLAGTPDGLNIIDGRRIQLLTSADGLPDDFVRSIYQDQDGSLWVGTRRGLAHGKGNSFSTYTVANGLPSDLIGTILPGQNGCLWVGTLKGLSCFRNGSFSSPAALAPLKETAITSLFEDRDGSLWIGTDGVGLAQLRSSGLFLFPTAAGLPKTVSGIVEDSDGELWITSPRGLFRVAKADLNAYADQRRTDLTMMSYGTGDGLPVNEFSPGGHPVIAQDRAHTIWLASARGVVAVDARHSIKNRVPPPVVIEQVNIDDRSLDPSQQMTFGPGLSRISFQYTGLSFTAPQQVRFRYKLEGFENKWIDAGTRRTAYYTGLGPKRYRFLVMARNNDGVWSVQNAALSFRVKPHFYQTSWFWGALVLALAALAYELYRWRVRHVKAEFVAVLAERTRIAREIHDTLAQGFVAVSVQLELVQRLMTSSAESAKSTLQQTQDLVKDCIADARRSIWSLRSESGPGEDLPSKLSKAVRKSTENNGLEVSVEIKGAYRPLPAQVEAEVLRIGQEAVTNVVRHAAATRLEVSLAFDENKARMTISDDGQGFVRDAPDAELNGHYGLKGMRERAESINAKLSVNTVAGKGTQVFLELPFK